MPLSNPADILLAHDTWATERILDACAGLSDAQFHQVFKMGLGSLHDTLAHIMGAIRGWTDMLAGQPPSPRIEEAGPYTVDQLRALLAEVAAAFNAVIDAHPLDDIATAERGGRSFAFPRGGVLTHVTTHGMHHRAQCLNMLRHLGVEPQPPSSVLQWMLTAND